MTGFDRSTAVRLRDPEQKEEVGSESNKGVRPPGNPELVSTQHDSGNEARHRKPHRQSWNDLVASQLFGQRW